MVDEPAPSATFGAELRRRRVAANMTLTQLASLVHYSKSHLSKIETGEKEASPALARRCDELMNCDGALVSLSRPRSARTAGSGPQPSGDHWAMRLHANGSTEFHAFDQPAVAGVVTPTLAWAVSPAPGRSAGAEVALPAFRTLLQSMRMLGQRVDPGLLTTMLMGAASSLRSLAADARPASRDQALRLAARFAEYTGWLAQEKDDEKAAIWWTNYAVSLAAAGGDDDFGFYGKIRLAEIELYRDNSIGVVELARAARAGSRRARVRSLALQREAQGHAVAGDAPACARALDEARAQLVDGDLGAQESRDEPALGSMLMPDPLAFVTAWCMQDLGRSELAIEILTQQLARTPAHALRVRARYGARLALALADAGEVALACATVQPVLAAIHMIDSATVRSDLRRLGRTLNRSRGHEAVREISADLAVALRR